jgi:hypothetical protein
VAQFTVKMIFAIKRLHLKDMYHTDVKPSNIMAKLQQDEGVSVMG